MAYLIDTDIFITAKNLHYGMDFCPAFWDWLIRANQSAKLISVEAVHDDLVEGGDELADWAKTRGNEIFASPAESDLSALGQVTQWINDHKTYTSAAKQTFLNCSDYFVVSQALAGRHTVITHEKPENSIHRVKIPSVCVALKVKYMTCWQMLRIERAKFILQELAGSGWRKSPASKSLRHLFVSDKNQRTTLKTRDFCRLQCRQKETDMFHAYAADKAKGNLKPFEFDPGPLAPDGVEINVDYCGVCHSDLSMLDNEWGMSKYPFVGGHEVAGTVAQVGNEVKHLKKGDRIGLGWYSGSCMICPQCMSGNHNLCPFSEGTIIGRFGGFGDKVRCKAAWAIPIPQAIDPAIAGPLFCGGVTVFNPIVQFDIKPTDRVGVIGIGGLGHLALQFLNKWGCDVTAFTSSDSKREEATKLGAHHVVNSKNESELKAIANQFDFIISTVNVPLQWETYIAALAPKGRLHFVGAVTAPVSASVFQLLTSQRSISASPLGSPATTAKMLDFCSRHDIKPVTENYPMSKINEAIEHLRAGKARYRIVLKNDMA